MHNGLKQRFKVFFEKLGETPYFQGSNLPQNQDIVNQQKFSFEYVGTKNICHLVHAKKAFSIIGYTQMDLGIAKYHFEIGDGKENFDWV